MAAGICIVCFGGNTTSLIPLYSVGVFVCFTLSQIGMVRHWLKRPGPRAGAASMAINAFGAILTFVVLIVVWRPSSPTSLLVAVIIPILSA